MVTQYLYSNRMIHNYHKNNKEIMGGNYSGHICSLVNDLDVITALYYFRWSLAFHSSTCLSLLLERIFHVLLLLTIIIMIYPILLILSRLISRMPGIVHGQCFGGGRCQYRQYRMCDRLSCHCWTPILTQ